MTVEPLVLTVGDTAPTLTGSINADATGATGEIHIRRPDATVIERAVTFPVTGPTESTWSAVLQTGDLNQGSDLPPGAEYQLELEVTFASGKIQTYIRDPATGRSTYFLVRNQYA